jgi:radical SAM superfamily enzyme YgiQ (UPF0313 family)
LKVLLVNPPAFNTIVGNNPEIIDEERGFNPPLGLLYLAGYLKKFRPQYEVEVLDAQVEELTYEQLKEKILLAAPDVVGFTTMTLTLLDVLETGRLVRMINHKIKIIWGGPHVHLYPEETIKFPEVDYLVLGEGERTFAELLDNLENPEKLKEIPGLVLKEGGFFKTGEPVFIEDLDTLPPPARQITSYQKYSSVVARRTPVTTMITSRGCPFRCIFCDRPHLGKRFRAHSPKYVVDEMEVCLKMGIAEILVYDDTFTVDRPRAAAICDEIVRRKLEFGWDIRARVNSVDEELLKKLKAAGCSRIHYGVEAGTDEILKILRKGITLEEVRRAFSLTKKIGIQTLGYFMIGSPGESRQHILKTIEFARRLSADFVHITITTPFPATELYRLGIQKGIFGDFWREFARNPQPGFKPKYWNEYLSEEELQELIVKAYKSFYLRPTYITRKIFGLRSFGELGRKMKAGLKVLTMGRN